MKNKMKQLFGIILSLVLVLGLMPGMSMMVYADNLPSVPVSPEESGTVTVEEKYEYGQSWYYFTASPAEGYVFDHWEGLTGSDTNNPLVVPKNVFDTGNWDNFSAVFVEATNPTIGVIGVELNKTSATLTVGNTETLTATVTPDNATNKSVTWTSSDTAVATVENGVVTAIAAGNATITVTTTDGSKTAACAVTVNVADTDSGNDDSSGSSSDSGSSSSSGGSSDSGNTGGGTSSGSSDNTNTNTDTGAKVPYDDVAISTGSVNDITGTAAATAESNPFGTKIENNSNLTTLLSLTDAEVAQGVNVWLDIQDMSASVSQTDKTLIQNTSGDYTVGLYLDINLFKKVGSNDATKVTETNGKVKASIVIPESLWKSGRTFEIIRVHDGVATAIAGTYDENTHVFTFETDKFSTYALAYKDATSSDNNSSTSDSSTSSDSSSSNSSNSTQSTAPKTGDPNDIRVWYLLLIASLGGLGLLGLSKKKEI